MGRSDVHLAGLDIGGPKAKTENRSVTRCAERTRPVAMKNPSGFHDYDETRPRIPSDVVWQA